MTRSRKPSKTALITGGAKRIGKALAEELAKQGYAIALHCNSSIKDAQTVQKKLNRHTCCAIFPCDLADSDRVEMLIPDVLKIFGRLDVLINSASIFEPGSIRKSSLGEFDRHMTVNFKAPLILTSAFARLCRRGNIINILDTNVVKNKISHVPYLLSKKSLLELTQLSALELGPEIRVNAVAPGLILPPEGQDIAYLNRRALRVPLKKRGSVRDVCSAVTFLLEQPFVTGQVILADGGEHLI